MPEDFDIDTDIADTEMVELPRVEPTDSGWTTPLTDRAAWHDGYKAAVLATTGFQVVQLRGLGGDQAKQFRTDVTLVMRSVGLVSPWDMNLQGVPWHYIAKVYDPTSHGARLGDGDRRIMKDINGLTRRVSTGELIDTSRRYQQQVPATPNKPAFKRVRVSMSGQTATATQQSAVEEPSTQKRVQQSAIPYKYEGGTSEQRSIAYLKGRELKAAAQAQGKPSETARMWGMLGVCIMLRMMDLPPHLEYETELKMLGVTEAYLRSKSKAAA